MDKLKEYSSEHGYKGYIFIGLKDEGVDLTGNVPWEKVATTLLRYAPGLVKYMPNIFSFMDRMKQQK